MELKSSVTCMHGLWIVDYDLALSC